jgi:hypothetical protein
VVLPFEVIVRRSTAAPRVRAASRQPGGTADGDQRLEVGALPIHAVPAR